MQENTQKSKNTDNATNSTEEAHAQTAALKTLAEEWRQNLSALRRVLPFPRRSQPPAPDFTDIRRSIAPLEAVEAEPRPTSRLARALELVRWFALTVIPVAVASIWSKRSKKFRD